MTMNGPRNPIFAFPFQTSAHERARTDKAIKKALHHASDTHDLSKAPNAMTAILTVPGLGGSGPHHWQSHWESERTNCSRVLLPDWNIPDRHAWSEALDQAVRGCDEPPIIAAHSLGCILLAHWAHQNPDVPVRGALMVAPADVDDLDAIPAEATVFAPIPMKVLPFPTTVLASSNDAYISLRRAQVLATAWGADFHNLGPLGHINADSHLQSWDAGWDYIEDLRSQSGDRRSQID